MCGIVGFVNFERQRGQLRQIAHGMANALAHRGPNRIAAWGDDESGVYFGHSRLSILDLTDSGNQPMKSSSGRYVIVYNGEVYNFRELRRDLTEQGVSFSGESDTEVILQAVEQWGIERTVQKISGMFAFGIFDTHERALTLVRDPMGKKPLFYGWLKDCFVFSSELKALTHHPSFDGQINRDAIAQMLRTSYISAPWSAYQGIFKVPAGTYLQLSTNRLVEARSCHNPFESESGFAPRRYWHPDRFVSKQSPIASVDGYADEFERLLKISVEQRMVADVPVGAFLSGGVDSSLIVSLAREVVGDRLKTFAIGFKETEYDEVRYAEKVAKLLNTDHSSLVLDENDAVGIIEKLPYIYDEPFGDSSAIPCVAVSELARKSVVVALSGDGGDEIFAGYDRYWTAETLARVQRTVSAPLLRRVAPLLRSPLGKAYLKAREILSGKGASGRAHHRLLRLAEIIQQEDGLSMFKAMCQHWDDVEALVPGAKPVPTYSDFYLQSAHPEMSKNLKLSQLILLQDFFSYLPGGMMTKVDRAGMSVGLEVRSPLLDRRLVELAFSDEARRTDRTLGNKTFLKRVLYKKLPAELFDRRKMGFGVPLDHWLRGSLKDWMCDTLSEARVSAAGLMEWKPIELKLRQFLSGVRPWDQHLWDALMVQTWHDKFHNSYRVESHHMVSNG